MKFRPTKKWLLQMTLSLVLPALLLIFRPIGLDLRQSAVAASVLLAIIWWSTGLVGKIPASLFLIAAFLAVSGAPLEKVFSFPLSETFPMIVVTYLFSQAIANAGLIDKIFLPPLCRFVHTPVACLAAIAATFYVTMEMIPQPLARVIIVAAMFNHFLGRTTLPESARAVLMYAVFLSSAVVNMSARDADIIMNRVAAGFSPVTITNGFWMREMAVPTFVCLLFVAALFILLFRREMLGRRIELRDPLTAAPFSRQQKLALTIIVAIVALWMTKGLHGINDTVVTVVATAALFGIGVLHREDLRTIDVTTLIFLSAAFSIGGVMDACGAAEKIFGSLSGIFPAQFSVIYLWLMVLVSMALHMVLGSNTTTLSVVVPGMILLCGEAVPAPVIVFTAIISVSFHALLPFHSVSLMIGAYDGYFPGRYVTRVGLPATIIVYAAAAAVFLPWWKLTGLM